MQFGYDFYHGFETKLGWLLSYNIERDREMALHVTFYFVDEFSNNFKIRVGFFPSLVVQCKEDLCSVEEYLKRRYEGSVERSEVVERIDVKEFNHLNRPPGKYLKLYFRTEPAFQQCVKSMKEIAMQSLNDRYKNEIYTDYFQDVGAGDVTGEIVQIHEYDIPYEVQVGTEFGVRCGCWYGIAFDGEKYTIVPNKERIAYPDLRIFAFDIETTKPPLKFPNAAFDKIMMVSIMTEDFGELIVNRQIVSENIEEFEYNAKDEMRCMFRVSNEATEEALLVRFLEVILEHRPHVITTYNGSSFDWPFICKRLSSYGMDLYTAIQFKEANEYFDCPFIIHLDCYRWVKRDSYLPMNNQGLKDVTRIKLGYFPDEIDPEDMVRFASEDPHKLASYSVSDAVATYYLYLKYVHTHIFSLCSLIPLPPVQVLCRGSGTLCEALLLAESVNYKILVPLKRRTEGLEYYKGHIAENITYVGGHVESLKAGIHRSDIEQTFSIDPEMIELISSNIDEILAEYVAHPEYSEKRDEYIQEIKSCAGSVFGRGCIYHLDVGAMYPNIILTNKLQPISVVSDDICVRCDYNDERAQCRRKMEWMSRVEYIPPGGNEVNMIKNQLENETFTVSVEGETTRVAYKDMQESKRESILKEKVLEYSKTIHKRVKKTEENLEDIYICQREIPFYVETVKKFRDQRYVYKDLYKKALQTFEQSPTNENKKNLVVYNSIQVAYKCILNSFYGYAMRVGSRWFSLEMAATVCKTGGEIIKLAKEFIEKIGTPLELDTDGIWSILPERFPQVISLGGKNISILSLMLNYFVCKKFTNYQYQVLNSEGKYEAVPQNSIFFELDGPYKTMIIPASTEENKLLKKRYVVFDSKNKIVELKGFELKRRGELNFVKKFQEDIFAHFNDGSTLQECYASLAGVCNYWLDIIDMEGGPLDEESIFYLFSESRNMSKNVESYANRKSSILSTVRRMSEFLGEEILEEKLKCEFVISRFPQGAPVVDRAIPVMVFRSAEKEKYLRKWLKTANKLTLREILDWTYYRKRFESILHRLIVIPAHLQSIPNPVPRVEMPDWVKSMFKQEKLTFSVCRDIEERNLKKSLASLFYTRAEEPGLAPAVVETKIEFAPAKAAPERVPEPAVTSSLKGAPFAEYISKSTKGWMEFYKSGLSFHTTVIEVEATAQDIALVKYLNGRIEPVDALCSLYLDASVKTSFAAKRVVPMYLPDQNCTKDVAEIRLPASEVSSQKHDSLLSQFCISRIYNTYRVLFQLFSQRSFDCGVADCIVVSSFNYQKKPVFVLSAPETFLISDIKRPDVLRGTPKELRDDYLRDQKVILFSRTDPNAASIRESFSDLHLLAVDLTPLAFLETFENLVKIHIDFNARLLKSFNELVDISQYAGIPLLNIDDSVLDLMLYRHFLANGVMPVQASEFTPRIVKDEMHKSAYCNTFCVQFEATNSFVLSILEYKTTASDISLYYGYQRKDFQVFKKFLRELVVAALQGNQGLKSLLPKISHWAKKTSQVMDSELRQVLETTHQRYNIGLISALRENQVKVIAASKDLLVVDTEKASADGCESYVSYLKKKISTVPGYELLNLKPIKIFEKLGLVDHANYVYLENGGEISGFTECKIPLPFLKSYFSENEVTNDEMYALVKSVDRNTLRLMLRLLSYQRDIHGLASNCYRLMRCSEFEDQEEAEFSLSVFCSKCGFENFLRKRCIKCYTLIEKQTVEAAAREYLKHCWRMHIFGDRTCQRCNSCEDRRMKEYCYCGGKLARKTYSEEVARLQKFVSSKIFDDEVARFNAFFGQS